VICTDKMKRSQYITAPVAGEDRKVESEHIKIGAKDEIKNITERLGEMKVDIQIVLICIE
jgi:hypothetical protein